MRSFDPNRDENFAYSVLLGGSKNHGGRKETKEQRFEKVTTYRELYLLPRFVIDEHGGKRMLEPGEFHPKSELYSLFTPIRELSDFGKCFFQLYFIHSWNN